MLREKRVRLHATLRVLSCAVLAAALGNASGPAPASAEESAAPAPRVRVAGATIAGVYDAPVRLQGGRYEGPPFAPGGASRPTLLLLDELVVFADLDGAAGDEAVALLAENSGGSGERIYLSVIALAQDPAASLATTGVGDRTRIRSLSVADREIVLEVVETGPEEPACCPTQLARKRWALRDGALVPTGSEITGRLSLALLAGGQWTALEIDGEPLPAGAKPPTASFEDGRIGGFGGCNRYSGPIREGEPGEIEIGPVAGTMMACPEPQGELEARFLASLGKATGYTFLAGRLALSGVDGEQMRSVLFERR